MTDAPPPEPAQVIWPDFTANALRRYNLAYEQLVRWLANLPMTSEQIADAARASYTQHRLLNEAGYVSHSDPSP